MSTRDPAAAARAYISLGWSLTLGHRYRPRQGCTCAEEDCALPGAHPLAGESPQLHEDTVDEVVSTAPGAALIAGTNRFDVIMVPRMLGVAVMAELDRRTPTPCFFTEDSCALLVLPSTGLHAVVDDGIDVYSGPEGWVALPPSRGVRWDTAPWLEGTATPRELLHGVQVRPSLEKAFRMSRSGTR
ncbi:hypothetical protein [Streptomyces sp. AD55]|uniref:hypothetical protein n=1 Tax=Streptomyces sp. AD55 TaxID=3242895 RepID=UPI00352825F8